MASRPSTESRVAGQGAVERSGIIVAPDVPFFGAVISGAVVFGAVALGIVAAGCRMIW